MIFERPPKLSNPLLLAAFAGWNDAGSAATTAVQYVGERRGATRVGAIAGDDFLDFTVQRPTVRLGETQIRQIDWPEWELSVPEAGDVVLLTGVEPHLRWRAFCACVVEAARELQVARVCLLGSFLAQVVYSDPVPITGFSSDPELLKSLHVGATSYQGPTGIVGVLADALRQADLPVVSLWAAVPHYIGATPNPRAALALLLRLRDWIDLGVELGPLEAAATTFQAKLLEAVEGDANLSNYVRGLKKDEQSH